MYTPPGAIAPTRPTLRVAIQGEPGIGKTFSALTFPNPVVIDFDHKVPVREGVLTIPFWDYNFVDKYMKEQTPAKSDGRLMLGVKKGPPNVRDAFRHWLETHASKFAPDQTLVLDSWTMLQNWFDTQTWLEPDFASRQKDSVFAFYRYKATYACAILDALKSCVCNVVVIFHEVEKKEKTNDGSMAFLGRTRPLMDGSFVAQLPGHFTDWYRMLAEVEIDPATRKPVAGASTKYYWQLKPDNEAGCNTSYITSKQRIPATYDALLAELAKK